MAYYPVENTLNHNRLGAVPGLVEAGTSIVGKVVGSIFGTKPEWLKKYFGGHWDRYEQRLTRKDFFRWGWYDINNNYWLTADGRKDLAQVFSKAGVPVGTVADAYRILFPGQMGTVEDQTAMRNGYYSFSGVSDRASQIITLFDSTGKIYTKNNAATPPSMMTPSVVPGQVVSAGVTAEKLIIPAAVAVGLYLLAR